MERRNKEEDWGGGGVKGEVQKVTSKERPAFEKFRGSSNSQQNRVEKSKMDPPSF